MNNFTYLVGDETTKTCAVIDPGWEKDKIIDQAKKLGFKITHILLTHGHFDHVNGAKALAKETGARIFIHQAEADVHQTSFKDNEKISVGDLKITCMHTPGHTQGSTCFIVNNAIFTGDTLFVDAIGRTDLDGSSEDQMILSLKKLAKLPDNMLVYPGHDYGNSPTTTIGEQKKTTLCNHL